jgi:hypothetical protein
VNTGHAYQPRFCRFLCSVPLPTFKPRNMSSVLMSGHAEFFYCEKKHQHDQKHFLLNPRKRRYRNTRPKAQQFGVDHLILVYFSLSSQHVMPRVGICLPNVKVLAESMRELSHGSWHKPIVKFHAS